jgi:hypothetical protein
MVMDRWVDGCDQAHHWLVDFQVSECQFKYLNQIVKYIDSHVSGMEEQFSYLNQSVNKLMCISR